MPIADLELISDGNLYALPELLASSGLKVSDAYSSLYEFLDSNHSCHKRTYVFFLADSVYKHIQCLDIISTQDLQHSLEQFCSLFEDKIHPLITARCHIVLTLVPTHFAYISGSTWENSLPYGHSAQINLFNSSLQKVFSSYDNISFINGLGCITDDLSKLWFRYGTYFNASTSSVLTHQLVSLLSAHSQEPKKLVVLDLDNTLWGGVISDDGKNGIRLGYSDHLGSIFLNVQHFFLNLKRKGALIAICSKNDESTALDCLFNHPSSVFTPEDIVAYKINWYPKSDNINALIAELNILPSSVVFVDDSPIECEEVAKFTQGVEVFCVPRSLYKYLPALQASNLFLTNPPTTEDAKRTLFYRNSLSRKTDLQTATTLGKTKLDWLSSLDMQLLVNHLSPNSSEVSRISQLFNRTNQFNLSGNKYSQSQLSDSLSSRQSGIIYISLGDKYGHEGIISALSYSTNTKNGVLVITDFVLSCRVFGRFIEYILLQYLLEFTENILPAYSAICFDYTDTGKNTAVVRYLSTLGLQESSLNAPILKATLSSNFPDLPSVSLVTSA